MRVSRSRGAICGTLLVILGAWVALIPFVGPLFDYSVGSTTAWDWTAGRLWLNVLPGGVAILAGLSLAGAVRRISLGLAGWFAALAGAWIVIGPEVSRVWNDGVAQSGLPYGGMHRQVVEVLGYSLLSGAAITALGAFAVGRASLVSVDDVRDERVADQALVYSDSEAIEPTPARTVPAQPVATQPTDASPGRRGPLTGGGRPSAPGVRGGAAATRSIPAAPRLSGPTLGRFSGRAGLATPRRGSPWKRSPQRTRSPRCPVHQTTRDTTSHRPPGMPPRPASSSNSHAAGFGEDLRPAPPPASLHCGACGSISSVEMFGDIWARRLEGASDPDDMVLVVGRSVPGVRPWRVGRVGIRSCELAGGRRDRRRDPRPCDPDRRPERRLARQGGTARFVTPMHRFGLQVLG